MGFDSFTLEKPRKRDADGIPKTGKKEVIPSDCREGHFTYAGNLSASMFIQNTGESSREHFDVDIGNIPIMVGSERCHLHNKSPQELIAMKEDETERGGYFICNGNERIIRLLIMAKANHLIAMDRRIFFFLVLNVRG